MELLEYWSIIWKRKWLIILLFVAAVVTAYFASSSMTPVYEASTTIMVREMPTMEDSLLAAFSPMGQDSLQNYVEILKTRTLAQKTAERLETGWEVTDPEFKAFKESISVQPLQGTEVIKVAVQSDDPQFARDAANTLIDEFIQANQEANRAEASSAKNFIAEQLKVVEEDLRRAEDALQEFKEREKIIAPTEETKAAIERIAELESMRAEAVVGRREVETKLKQIRGQLAAQDETLVSATTVSNNPLVQQYKGKLAELEAQLSATLEMYTESHPEVISLRAEIRQVREALNSEVEKIVSAETRTVNPIYQSLLQQMVGYQVELVALQAREDALQRLISEQEELFANLPAKELELVRLERRATVAAEIYTMLAKNYEEVRISEAMKTANVRVLDRAITPEQPIKPRVKLNVAIAGFLGLFVGFGLAFLLEYLDTTIKTPDEVEELSGLPVLAQIPDFASIEANAGRRRR